MNVRKRYNKEHNPLDFMFIMRTTTNGMPRYNQDGEFNNSFHVTRNGILPDKLDKIIYEWNKLLKDNQVEFITCSYNEVSPIKDDFVYLDPPYANTKGMYYGTIDYEKLWNWIKTLPCEYALSFDGVSGEKDNSYNVPKDIYTLRRLFYKDKASI